MFGIKCTAYFITSSNSILTDALESIANIAAGGFGLYSLWLASRPRDQNHPYGHGKIEFIYSSIEGILILLAGIFATSKGGYNLIFANNTLSKMDTGLWLIGLTALINLFAGKFLEKKGNKSHSLTLQSGGKHLISDAYSTVGIIIGGWFAFYFKLPIIDNLMAIGFGIWIGYIGCSILRKSVAGIMDEADEAVLQNIIAVLESKRKEDWIDIHNLRVIKYGAILHVDCHVTVPYFYDVEQAHDIVKEIEDITTIESGRELELFIHVDPCIKTSCKLCQKQDCKVRKHAFEGKVIWDLVNVSKNQKHSI